MIKAIATSRLSPDKPIVAVSGSCSTVTLARISVHATLASTSRAANVRGLILRRGRQVSTITSRVLPARRFRLADAVGFVRRVLSESHPGQVELDDEPTGILEQALATHIEPARMRERSERDTAGRNLSMQR